MKKDTPGVYFSAIFSNSLNMKRRRVLPLSDSLKLDDIGFRRSDVLQAYAIPIKLVNKNNWGTRQKWWGNWNRNHCRVGSMSLLNMALVCIRVWVGTSHLIFHLPPWVWVILFDLSSALCLVAMTSDRLTSNIAKSTVVLPICSREVDLCEIINLPLITHIILIHKKYYPPLSRVDDVGNIMAHLRSRSLPVDFSSLSRKLT